MTLKKNLTWCYGGETLSPRCDDTTMQTTTPQCKRRHQNEDSSGPLMFDSRSRAAGGADRGWLFTTGQGFAVDANGLLGYHF